MADFIPVLDSETKLQRKKFVDKYLGCEELVTNAIFVDEQRFWYDYHRCFFYFVID